MRAVIRTGELQLRPVLMTCVVAGVGLLPAALSEGIGSQVQKPLAVGGRHRHDAGAAGDPGDAAGADLGVLAPGAVMRLWAHAHVSCPLGLWLTRSGGRPLIPAGTTRRRQAMRIEESQGSNEDRTAGRTATRSRRKQRRPPSRFSAKSATIAARPSTAESTFGRLVVNDGKLVSRLRDGARITTGTLDKVRAYLAEHQPASTAAAEPAVTGRQAAERRGRRQRRRAAGLPILRQPPEIPAVRLDLQREDRGRPTASRSSSAICSRRRRRCASSMPASATAPCCRG